jgi:hypothetical protein
MRRMLDDLFGGLGWPPVLGERAGWSPPVDVEETDDAYVAEAARRPTTCSSVSVRRAHPASSSRIRVGVGPLGYGLAHA